MCNANDIYRCLTHLYINVPLITKLYKGNIHFGHQTITLLLYTLFYIYRYRYCTMKDNPVAIPHIQDSVSINMDPKVDRFKILLVLWVKYFTVIVDQTSSPGYKKTSPRERERWISQDQLSTTVISFQDPWQQNVKSKGMIDDEEEALGGSVSGSIVTGR